MLCVRDIATPAGCDPEADRSRTLHGTPWGRAGQGLQLHADAVAKTRALPGCPELELSNNLAENSMRPVALGRRNRIHIGSAQAGPKIAAILSVVESCRRLKFPVRDYLALATVLPGLADYPIQGLPELTPAAMATRRY
jgi:Transposase IS66 family